MARWFQKDSKIMSKQISANPQKITVPAIRSRKVAKGASPIVSLTAYSKPMAQMLDPHVDLILVGDSLGMVLYGFDTTLPVTLDMMIQHASAVMRGAKQSLVIVDMPFGTYQASPEQAYMNAARVMAETGCAGVKIEGGTEMANTVSFLTQRGIPVLGHIGLLPQSLNTAGGYRSHGRNQVEADNLLKDARALQDAGAFAIVLEGIVEPLAAEITAMIDIPTIGIGASPACDGQILVTDDMIGLFQDFTPKFVRQFAQVGQDISKAIGDYATAVRTHQFPTDAQCFGVQRPVDKEKKA